MVYLLVAAFVPLFLYAEFDQECRFIRIARNQSVRNRDLFIEMTRDGPTVVGTVLLIACFAGLMIVIALGYRFPENPIPFVALVALLLAAAALKGIGFRRLIRTKA
jgi:hypothetical protein